MKAVLIFDNINDLLYHKWDDNFLHHIQQLNNGEFDNSEAGVTEKQHVSQLLAPIIASQRVMSAQFSNTYTSMQCKDKTNLVFDEWLDHVLIIISEDDVEVSHRELLDCKTLIQHICGQNINLLRSPIYQEWLSNLLESRDKGDAIPGATGVIGESGATAAALSALKSAAKELKFGFPHYHLMLFVGDKMLALYSSRGSDDLTPTDIMLLSIQCIAAQEFWNNENIDSSEYLDYRGSQLPWLSLENSGIVYGNGGNGAPCVPHSLHVASLAPRIVFALLVDTNMRDLGIATHMSSELLSNANKLLLQRNTEILPSTLDSLDAAVKKLVEALRRNKSCASLGVRLSTRAQEFGKAAAGGATLAAETAATALQAAIEPIFDLLRPEIPSLDLDVPLRELKVAMSPYVDFLRVKAMRYFSIQSGPVDSSGSLTHHKYTEEFPGLIHFVYIDRTAGRFFAPDMADCADILTADMVRAAVRRSSSLAHAGYVAAAWRGARAHVLSWVWWERGGAPVSPPAPPPPAAVRALPPPADLTQAFYRQLTELAFPSSNGQVSVKELICIHLGLVPAATAAEQARRLACSVRDLAASHYTHHLL